MNPELVSEALQNRNIATLAPLVSDADLELGERDVFDLQLAEGADPASGLQQGPEHQSPHSAGRVRSRQERIELLAGKPVDAAFLPARWSQTNEASRFTDQMFRLVVGIATIAENLRYATGVSSASRRFRFCHRTAQFYAVWRLSASESDQETPSDFALSTFREIAWGNDVTDASRPTGKPELASSDLSASSAMNATSFRGALFAFQLYIDRDMHEVFGVESLSHSLLNLDDLLPRGVCRHHEVC